MRPTILVLLNVSIGTMGRVHAIIFLYIFLVNRILQLLGEKMNIEHHSLASIPRMPNHDIKKFKQKSVPTNLTDEFLAPIYKEYLAWRESGKAAKAFYEKKAKQLNKKGFDYSYITIATWVYRHRKRNNLTIKRNFTKIRG